MKKYLVVFLSLMLLFTLTACADSEPNSEKVDIEDPVEEANGDDAGDKDIDENEKKQEVTLYFANEDYIITGDESLDKIIPQKKIIEYEDISLEEAVVRALMISDEITDSDTAIPESVKLIDVTVKDRLALVNFAQEGLSGGSLQETLTISQIVQTLLELDTVDGVKFLIDGQDAESLMGHVGTLDPFTE